MLQLLTMRRTSVIGVDVGACSVRAVQLQRGQGRWHVHHWVNIETEPVTGDPPEPDFTESMKLAFGPGTFTGGRAALLLSPPEVEFRLIEVPAPVLKLPPDELKDALRFELDRQMPWPTDECEIGAWPVQSGATSSANAMVVAARVAPVNRALELLQAVDVECVRADVPPHGMMRVCRQQEQPVAEPTLWGVLDIGFRCCRLYLVHAGHTVFARVLRGGGREVTESLARALHVEFRIAEQYKRIYGIQQTERGFRSAVGGLHRISEDALPGVLYAILRPMFEALAGEIERSCRFALGRLSGATVGGIYLVGGGSRLRGLDAVLSGRLGVPVAPPRPGGELAPTGAGNSEPHPALSQSLFPVLAPCAGLAVAEEEP